MQITIEDQGDRCAIIAASMSSNTLFPLSITSAALRDALRTILAAPLTNEHTIVQGLRLERQPDGINVVNAAGIFAIPYPLVFPLVLA